MTARAGPMPRDSAQARPSGAPTPAAVWPAFPVAGYVGWKIGGRVDAVDAALVGGALTGAGLSAVEWWAAKVLRARLSVASATGIGVGDQFTVFGAGGALLFMLLSGLLVARFTPARAPAA